MSASLAAVVKNIRLQRMAESNAEFEFEQFRILQTQRMSTKRIEVAAPRLEAEGPFWAACESDPTVLDFNGFGDGQCVFKLNTEITNRAIHLCVPK